mgnify:CR=1 FL=1
MSAADKPLVGIVMGSDSDLETMRRCMKQLDEFGVPYEVRVISAHRTPETAHEYTKTASERGLRVIIAAAGMSAALSGVLAARTTLPVVGVPMSAGPLVGVDAALSIMQMPPGIPVGTMSIGSAGATNAAIYAAQILALGDDRLAARLADYKKEMAGKVAEKDAAVQEKL